MSEVARFTDKKATILRASKLRNISSGRRYGQDVTN